MSRACVSFGANLGEPPRMLREAVTRLRARADVNVVAVSSAYDTPALGPPQPRYVNAAMVLETSLAPEALLAALHEIEDALGRRRGVRWGPRVIDLDLLLYGDQVVRSDALTLPHPEMHRRRFVLEPLAEVAPDARHPLLGRTVRELLAELPVETPPARRWHIALAGPIGAGKTTLAERLARRLDARLVREPVSHHPLLSLFYADRRRHALNTQLWFLLCRARQLRAALGDDAAEVIVADYFFEQDRLFAGLNLTPEEGQIYDAANTLVGRGLAPADVVIYLSAPMEVLIERIVHRGRECEQQIDRDYLARVAAMHEDYFAQAADRSVIRLNVEEPCSQAADDALLVRIAEVCAALAKLP